MLMGAYRYDGICLGLSGFCSRHSVLGGRVGSYCGCLLHSFASFFHDEPFHAGFYGCLQERTPLDVPMVGIRGMDGSQVNDFGADGISLP